MMLRLVLNASTAAVVDGPYFPPESSLSTMVAASIAATAVCIFPTCSPALPGGTCAASLTRQASSFASPEKRLDLRPMVASCLRAAAASDRHRRNGQLGR